MKKKSWKKSASRALIVSTVCSLTIASGAMAETTTTTTLPNNTFPSSTLNQTTTTPPAAATPALLRYFFTDVPQTHWALKHITKLSLLGIVEGVDSGNYAPESSVTQEQVITMAIRMMGLEQEALRYQGSFVVSFAVQDYARPYLRMAIEKGLININEEAAAAAANSSAWGSRQATREWVAKIVIRAIGQESEALRLTGTPTSFADNNKITSGVVGHINQAVELKIVNGFDDNTFRPDGTVTRAQMATFLSRAEKYLKASSARVVKGYISGLSANKISIQDELGAVHEYTLQSSTIYYSGKDDRRMTLTGIRPSNEVYLIQEGGSVYFVEVTNDEVPMDTFEGKLVQTSLNDLSIVLNVNGTEQLFKLTPDASVIKADGTGASLAQLLPGSTLELRRNKILRDAGVSEILVKREPVVKTVEAFFQKINGQQLQVTNKTNNTTEVYNITGETVISNAAAVTTADELYEGDQLSLTIVDDIIQSINITFKAVDSVDRGKLVSLVQDQKLITIEKTDGSFATYKYADTMNVVIDGLNFASIRDLAIEDSIVVEIKDNRIIRTRISNRSVQNNMVATIVNYDANRKLLTVLDSNGKPEVFNITDQTTFEYDNRAVTLSQFSQYFQNDKRVIISVSQKNVRSVKYASSFEGKLVGKSVSELVLELAGGQQMSFKLTNTPGVLIAGKPSANFNNDLKLGDQVKLLLNADQGIVYAVQVKSSLMLRVQSKTGSYVTMRNAEGSTFGYEISTVNIAKSGIASPTHNDVRVNDYVVMEFAGLDLQKVTVLQTTLGKVTGVDAATGKINVQTFGNIAQSLVMGSSTKVILGTNTYSDLSQIKVGDRIESVRDANGNYEFTIIRPEVRKFTSYNVSAKQITFQRRNLDEQYIFDLPTDAYVHKGEQQIDPAFLINNDTLNVYLLGGEIIEIEKN
jgi:trimeric autotransporter adhesin